MDIYKIREIILESARFKLVICAQNASLIIKSSLLNTLPSPIWGFKLKTSAILKSEFSAKWTRKTTKDSSLIISAIAINRMWSLKSATKHDSQPSIIIPFSLNSALKNPYVLHKRHIG